MFTACFIRYLFLVPDGIDDLVTGGIDWAGDATVLLSYVKGRTAAESVNLPKAAVRLLEQWLSHSALLRSFLPAGQQNALWPRTERPAGDRILVSPPARATLQGWIRRHEVTGQDGVPLKIHRHRIRTTHEAMRDTSAWWGSSRQLVDPNHSPRSEGDFTNRPGAVIGADLRLCVAYMFATTVYGVRPGVVHSEPAGEHDGTSEGGGVSCRRRPAVRLRAD